MVFDFAQFRVTVSYSSDMTFVNYASDSIKPGNDFSRTGEPVLSLGRSFGSPN